MRDGPVVNGRRTTARGRQGRCGEQDEDAETVQQPDAPVMHATLLGTQRRFRVESPRLRPFGRGDSKMRFVARSRRRVVCCRPSAVSRNRPQHPACSSAAEPCTTAPADPASARTSARAATSSSKSALRLRLARANGSSTPPDEPWRLDSSTSTTTATRRWGRRPTRAAAAAGHHDRARRSGRLERFCRSRRSWHASTRCTRLSTWRPASGTAPFARWCSARTTSGPRPRPKLAS